MGGVIVEDQHRQIQELLRENQRLQFALAETEALEMQHGAVISRLMTALKTIRESGNNEHPTCVWMQKVASHAMEPNKWPEQPTQPPQKALTV